MHAYRTRASTRDQSLGFYDETIGHVQERISLWSTSRLGSTLTPNFRLLSSALDNQLYTSLLAEFQPDRGQDGIFSADRQEANMLHHSSINLCVRALLDVSVCGIAILDQAILSLLMLYYGRLHGISSLVKHSQYGYAKVLADYGRFLAKALSTESACCYHFQVAAYISIALQLFEHIYEVQSFNEAQLVHIDGAVNLLQKCGPYALQNNLALRKAFSGLRGLAIFADLGRRKPSFLSGREWIGIPLDGQSRSMREELHDLALQIPTILASADGLISALPQKTMHVDDFTDKALHILSNAHASRSQLGEWKGRLEQSIPGPLYWPRTRPSVLHTSMLDNECKPKRSSNLSRLMFPCGPVAGILAQYWAFELELLMTSQRLWNMLRTCERSAFVRRLAPSALEVDSKAAADCARLILEAQPYLFSCFEGVIALQPPLTVAMRYYKENEV